MKVMLVNPKFPYKGRDRFPLGLAYIAAVLENLDGIEKIEIADESVGEDAKERIKKRELDVVCITSTTPSFERAKEIAGFCRERGIKVVFGGVHATFCPEQVLEVADVVVRGEGERTAEELFSGKPLKEIKGISWIENGKVFHNPPRELEENLDSLPLPAYELFPLEKYGMMSLVTSRGCFYNCSYCCATRFWGRKVRFHSVERILLEMELIQDLGFKLVKIHDSTFTLDRERVLKICEGMVERGIDLRWSCETRADHLDYEMLRKMKRAGCSLICMGIDSASEEVLRKNKRFFNLEYAKRVFGWCRELGIKTRAYLVFGLEGETEKSVRKTLEYLKEIRPDQIMLSLATAYPGTELYSGRKINLDPSWVAKFEGHGRGAELYLPSSLTEEEYRKLADWMWRKVKEFKRKRVL